MFHVVLRKSWLEPFWMWLQWSTFGFVLELFVAYLFGLILVSIRLIWASKWRVNPWGSCPLVALIYICSLQCSTVLYVTSDIIDVPGPGQFGPHWVLSQNSNLADKTKGPQIAMLPELIKEMKFKSIYQTANSCMAICIDQLIDYLNESVYW